MLSNKCFWKANTELQSKWSQHISNKFFYRLKKTLQTYSRIRTKNILNSCKGLQNQRNPKVDFTGSCFIVPCFKVLKYLHICRIKGNQCKYKFYTACSFKMVKFVFKPCSEDEHVFFQSMQSPFLRGWRKLHSLGERVTLSCCEGLWTPESVIHQGHY